MCYNASYLQKKAKKLAERYQEAVADKIDLSDLPEDLPVFYFVSGFAHPLMPIVKHDGIFLFQWGLVPHWAKDKKTADDIRNKTLNAVGETVFEKPSFRKSISSKRCLLPVSGFFEWRDYKSKKYPYYITCAAEEIFSLGCVYDEWVDKSTGEMLHTFSIVTVPANPLMEKIHNLKKRMPLIIDRNDERKWIDTKLSTKQVQDLILPFPENKMCSYTVSQTINSTRNERNLPLAIEKVDYSELEN